MIPTSTQVSVEVGRAVPVAAQAVVVFAAEKAKGGRPAGAVELLGKVEGLAAARLLSAGLAKGKAREIATDVVELPGGKHRQVIVAGLGAAEKLTAEMMRQAAGAVARAVRKQGAKDVAVLLPLGSGAAVSDEAVVEAVVSGILLASFNYEEYKGTGSRKDEVNGGELRVTLVAPAERVKSLRPAMERARIIADGQNFARTIASRPGNDVNPPSLAKVVQQSARELGLTCRVLDEKQMQRLGMGGILAVGGGSAHPPRMIVLENKPARGKSAKGTVLVVGKALTFDAGGISIKPAEKMGRMVYDKCGAMAVLGLMYAVAKLTLPVHVVGIMSSAENTLSGRAYRPGDLLRMHNGVTIEVTNTDAEGRLVLGDALAWGIKTFKPSAVVDLATLTGGVVVALGRTMAGVMGNNDQLVGELQRAADVAGEKFWRLPLGDEQREMIKSEMADIVNAAGREASPLQGAAFLSYFVPADGSVPWAHVDIAGVADTEKELPYYGKGATGWGVRMLVEWISRRAEAF
jgi:leucyl aminopeptidase